MKRFLQTSLALAYALYAWLLFLACGLLALIAVLLIPGLERRRATARAIARTFLGLAGMPLVVRHVERIPEGQCVIVANHASYLDGPVFTAALPPRFGFVVKREMQRVPLAGALLGRIGSQFVDRFDRQRGAADARRVLRTAVNGHSLMFFPEGTFSQQPGLLKFHTGAFATAVRAGCPVVPAVVRGTRFALASRSVLARPGPIDVEFLPAIYPAAADSPERAAVELRERARAAILRALREPDLSVAA